MKNTFLEKGLPAILSVGDRRGTPWDLSFSISFKLAWNHSVINNNDSQELNVLISNISIYTVGYIYAFTFLIFFQLFRANWRI